MTRLTKQKAKLENLLTGINPFNAKSRAEEICKILDTYLPSVEKMGHAAAEIWRGLHENSIRKQKAENEKR